MNRCPRIKNHRVRLETQNAEPKVIRYRPESDQNGVAGLPAESAHSSRNSGIISGANLDPENLAILCRMLEQEGVALVNSATVGSLPFTTGSSTHQPTRLLQSTTAQSSWQQTGGQRPVNEAMYRAPLKLMEAADREMRQIIYRFGFAARQHILRAEKLLACPSSERLDHVLAGSKFRSARQYLTALPNLVKLVRVLDQKAGSAYQKWRQDPPLANGRKYLAEFRRFNHELQRIFPKFCFQITVIQPMIAIAENLARQFRGSQRVQKQIHQARNPVCQLPLADVERQAIETMESFVRMPGDVFLLHCARLKTLVAQFEQARCQLIQEHLPLVASIAGTYRNGNLLVLPLMRAGIFGLLRAVEKYEYRYSWSFSNYAAGSIRRSMRNALEA